MKINSLKINDFKFYTEQYFRTNNKNILLYGENGSGKSSLYWALYFFYKCSYSTNPVKYIKQLDKTQENNLTNHYRDEDAKIIVTFDDTTNIVIDKNFTPSSSTQSHDAFKTIHFLNHEKLFTLFLRNNISEFNFYDVMEKEFFNKYELFNDLEIELKNMEQSLQVNQDTSLLNSKLEKALKKLRVLVNYVLKKTFKERLQVKFIVDDKFIAESNTESIWSLVNPKILITINNHNDFNLRMNEARVKLISLLIYFVLIEENNKYVEADANQLKLLVLDDILLSLDMAQRSKILEYIFEKFSAEYQLFIFTHDIFFYDLVKRKVMHSQNKTNLDQTTWEDRFVFSRKTPSDFFEPIIYKADYDYLNIAESFLRDNNLSECGNNIRKEMEKTIQQMHIEFEIGKRGELHKNIKVFEDLHSKKLFKESHIMPDHILEILEDNIMQGTEKLTCIKQLILSQEYITLTTINKLLKNFQWHRDIVGNASSHAQLLQNYRTEFQQAIEDVKKLKLLLSRS
jgi:hypothetical protein